MEGKTTTKKLTKKAPNVPTDPRALKRLERHIELGELEEISPVAGLSLSVGTRRNVSRLEAPNREHETIRIHGSGIASETTAGPRAPSFITPEPALW
jgi:hypothetical protein